MFSSLACTPVGLTTLKEASPVMTRTTQGNHRTTAMPVLGDRNGQPPCRSQQGSITLPRD